MYWSSYGSGNVPLISAQSQCTGSESTIFECSKDLLDIATTDCSSSTVAGVICEGIQCTTA